MESKKKILYVITKSNWGGAQKYVFDLATSLPKENFEAIVAFGGDGPLKSKLEEANIQTIQIASLHRDVSLFKDFSVFQELLSIYRKVQPDVIHLNSSKIGLLGSLAARLYQLSHVNCPLSKVIFTAHGWAFNEKRNFFSRLIIWKLSVWTSILATDIITLSKKEQKQAFHFFVVPRRKIHLIRNGIKEFPLLSREDARKKLGLSEDKKYVGSIAELHKNKGLDVLIKTAPQLDAHIAIIGAGEEEGPLKNLARKLEVSEKVHFLGPIDNAGTYLKAFDVFALPSRKEGLPYALLEAGYAGVPAVASNVGGIPEIIDNTNTGLLISPEDPEALKDATENLLHDRVYAEHLAVRGKEYIAENFSFEKTLELTLELY